MPAEYAIRYLPAAEDDLISIYQWIAGDNPSRAKSFIDELDRRIGNLKDHPHLGRVPRHPKLREVGYRVLVIEAYLIFYMIRGHTVEIHRVVHGSRHLEEIV